MHDSRVEGGVLGWAGPQIQLVKFTESVCACVPGSSMKQICNKRHKNLWFHV